MMISLYSIYGSKANDWMLLDIYQEMEKKTCDEKLCDGYLQSE